MHIKLSCDVGGRHIEGRLGAGSIASELVHAGAGSEAVSLEMDSLRDLVFWVSRREQAQVVAAPIQLSILVNTHRKKVEEEFKLHLQKMLAPKLMMGQSVAVDEAFIRDEFAKYERETCSPRSPGTSTNSSVSLLNSRSAPSLLVHASQNLTTFTYSLVRLDYAS